MEYINHYALEVLDRQHKVAEEYRGNKSEFVPVDMATGTSLVSLLEEHLIKWRPWDTRIYFQFLEGFSYQSKSSDITRILYQHLKLGILGREDKNGSSTLEVGIYLNKNIKRFEEYNKAVERSWDHELDFDPKTGRVGSGMSKGGYAATLRAPSEYVIGAPENKLSTGHLTIPAPEPSWGLRAVWRIDIAVEGKTFKVSHKVFVPGKKVLFEDKDTDTDLTELTSSMMHKVFGNTDFVGPEGDFGDGLRQLLAGEKSPKQNTPILTDTSDPRTWSRAVDLLMSFSKYTLLLGFLYLAWIIWQDGWNLSITEALVSVAVMVMGPVISAVLVPFSEAMHEKAKYKSIKL